jgi:hypothetical protein
MPVVGFSPGIVGGADSGVNNVFDMVLAPGEAASPVLQVYGMSRLAWSVTVTNPTISPPVQVVPGVFYRPDGSQPLDANWTQAIFTPVAPPALSPATGFVTFTVNAIVTDYMTMFVENTSGTDPVTVRIALSASA